VRFGLAGKGLWSVLDGLRAGPVGRNGLIAIEPRLTVQVNSSGDTRAAGDGVLLAANQVPRPSAWVVPYRHGNRAHGSRAVTMKSEPGPLATLGSSAGRPVDCVVQGVPAPGLLIDRPRRLIFTWISPGTDQRLSLEFASTRQGGERLSS